MANALISNVSTRGFRATTYNLGNALSGTVLVNASLGDVQYGTISANTTFQFSGWAQLEHKVMFSYNYQLAVASNYFPVKLFLLITILV